MVYRGVSYIEVVCKKNTLEGHHLFNGPSILVDQAILLLSGGRFSSVPRQVFVELIACLPLLYIASYKFPLCGSVVYTTGLLHHFVLQGTSWKHLHQGLDLQKQILLWTLKTNYVFCNTICNVKSSTHINRKNWWKYFRHFNIHISEQGSAFFRQ